MNLHRLRMARLIGLALALLAAGLGLSATPAPAVRADDTTLRASFVTHEVIFLRWDPRKSFPYQYGDYNLWLRHNAIPGYYEVHQRVNAQQGEASFGGLSPSRTYQFKFEDCWERGTLCTSIGMLTVTTLPHPVPVPPGNLRTVNRSAQSIHVRWTDTTSGEDRFELQWRGQGQPFWSWQTRWVDANVTTAVVSGLVPESSYVFRVRACAYGPNYRAPIDSECSVYSPEVTIETRAPSEARCGEYRC